jgi:hypothetical protein
MTHLAGQAVEIQDVELPPTEAMQGCAGPVELRVRLG